MATILAFFVLLGNGRRHVHRSDGRLEVINLSILLATLVAGVGDAVHDELLMPLQVLNPLTHLLELGAAVITSEDFWLGGGGCCGSSSIQTKDKNTMSLLASS